MNGIIALTVLAGAYRELWIWTADVKLWRTEMEGGVVRSECFGAKVVGERKTHTL